MSIMLSVKQIKNSLNGEDNKSAKELSQGVLDQLVEIGEDIDEVLYLIRHYNLSKACSLLLNIKQRIDSRSEDQEN